MVDCPEKAFDEIVEALSFLREEFKKGGVWQDAANPIEKEGDAPVSGSGHIMEAEALLCFLLPLAKFPEGSAERQRIYDIYSDKEIVDSLYDFLARLKDTGIYGASPYTRIQSTDGKEHPFIDTACYTISLILLAEDIFGPPNQNGIKKDVCHVFEACLKIVTGSIVYDTVGRAKGWSFTNHAIPSRPFKYATWMAVDTLSDFVSIANIEEKYYATQAVFRHYVQLKDVLPQVAYETARIYVDARHEEDEKEIFGKRNLSILNNAVVQEDEGDDQLNYNLWIIMTLLYAGYDNFEKIKVALDYLWSVLEEPSKRKSLIKDECEVYFEIPDVFKPTEGVVPSNIIEDRSFLPQFLKCMVLYALKNRKNEAALDEKIEQTFNWLLENRYPDVPAWDAYARRGDYAIYQTERAIEALCKYIDYCQLKKGASSSQRENNTEPLPMAGSIPSLSGFAQEIAEIVSKNAVRIEVSGEGVETMLRKEVQNFLSENKDELIASIRQEIFPELNEMNEALKSLGGKLGDISEEDTVEIVGETFLEIKQLSSVIDKAVENND